MAGPGDPRFDDPSFSRLFEDNYDAVRRYADRRIEERGGVDDVVAETFVVAWRRRGETPDQVLPWLYGVCRNVIANHRRSERRRRRLWSKLATERPALGRDPADVLASRSAMSAAFAQLPESQREVLRLVAWEGLTGAEAAVALGCSPDQVRVRFHRARKRLAQHLAAAGHEGPSLPAGAASTTRPEKAE